MRNATLGRHERLTGHEAISVLAKKGAAVNVAPFRLVGMITPLDTPAAAQVAFAIPKRHVKRAHDRNRIRRLMREAYRHEKHARHDLLRAAGKQCAWLFIYQAPRPVDLSETRHKISAALDRWLQQHLRA
jgi:ribonuclease P protein component